MLEQTKIHSSSHAPHKSVQLHMTMCLASGSCLYKTEYLLWQLACQHAIVQCMHDSSHCLATLCYPLLHDSTYKSGDFHRLECVVRSVLTALTCE